MSHTSKTPGSERVYGVEGPSLPPSLPLYLTVYRQHVDISVRQRTCSFSPGPDTGEEPRKSRETQFRHTSFEDLKTTGRYWWTLGESSGQKVQPACHTVYSVHILYRLYILYIEYEISLRYIIQKLKSKCFHQQLCLSAAEGHQECPDSGCPHFRVRL